MIILRNYTNKMKNIAIIIINCGISTRRRHMKERRNKKLAQWKFVWGDFLWSFEQSWNFNAWLLWIKCNNIFAGICRNMMENFYGVQLNVEKWFWGSDKKGFNFNEIWRKILGFEVWKLKTASVLTLQIKCFLFSENF